MSANTRSWRLNAYGTPPVATDHPIPVPTGSEVLLRVTHSGVCHSDVHIMDGHQDLGDGARLDFADTAMPIPLTMGHEIVGEVAATGDPADAALIGARRLVYPWIGCGTCLSCIAGRENHCEAARVLGIFRDGGYSGHVIVPHARYLLDIGDLDPGWAATLACSGLTTFSALRQLEPRLPGGRLAIVGMGGLGLMAVAVARALGWDGIIACDISDDRLDAARALEAEICLDTRSAGVDALQDAADGQLYGVIDTVGLPGTVGLGLGAVMKGGRIVLVGLQGGRLALRLPTLPLGATSLIGTYTGTLQELTELVSLARTGILRPIPVTLRPMACLNDALDALRHNSILGRTVLEPEP